MVFIRFLVFMFILFIALVISVNVIDRFMKDSMFETKGCVAAIIFGLFFFIGLMVIQYI
jgi:hypothetical protein